ncbi:hypothetical protein HanRHA438_Chr09g0378651 [Helianthus annuus]|nr:hypothetical protein HanRHA438_Chr09g0378651 [Helianthus annuus]
MILCFLLTSNGLMLGLETVSIRSSTLIRLKYVLSLLFFFSCGRYNISEWKTHCHILQGNFIYI